MADIYGYMYMNNETKERRIRLRAQDASIKCGSRFKYIAEDIGADYKDLVKALNDAIDEIAKNKGAEAVTNEKNVTPIIKELNFDELMNKFNSIVNDLANKYSDEEFASVWAPKIVQITEKYLGKGKKASQCTRDQVEMLELIVSDLEELVK